MFNSITSLLFSLFFLSACNNSDKTGPAEKDTMQSNVTDTIPSVKPVVDEHGCKPAEGETWSIVRNSCIRLADTGIKMEPQEGAQDKTQPAWLVFSTDNIRVEIILPTQKKPVIIRKSSAAGEPAKWANGPLTVSESNGIYTLDDEGKLLYRSVTKK